MSVPPVAPRADWGSGVAPRNAVALAGSRIVAFCVVEWQKLMHDRTELVTRAIQPVLWLVVFGETFSRVRAIPTGSLSYLQYMAPGIIAQSGMFVAIFYGIQIIWERDAGILAKLLVTPTPRVALIAGKSFAAAVRALAMVVVILLVSVVIGVGMTANPLRLLGAGASVVLGTIFFSCLSMVIAGLVMSRDRLMGIGQAITMPLFFASSALYPVSMMPTWLQHLSTANPLSYEVSSLRTLLLGNPGNLWSDFAVLTVAAVLGIIAASRLLGRLAR